MQDARIVHIKNTPGNSKTKQASCHAKKKKNIPWEPDMEIYEEVCRDRVEIMEWREKMMNGGHSNRSQVCSCVAGKDKGRRDDERWQETGDNAVKGETAHRDKMSEWNKAVALTPGNVEM